MPRFARRILDLQLPTSGFAPAHWHRYLQHPLGEVGLSFLSVDPLWQGKLTIEVPVGAFRAIETFAFLFVLLTAFPEDDQCVFSQFNLDVIFFDSRQISSHYQLPVVLKHFNLGPPHRHLVETTRSRLTKPK